MNPHPHPHPHPNPKPECSGATARPWARRILSPEHAAALAERREHADALTLGGAASMRERLQKLKALRSGPSTEP